MSKMKCLLLFCVLLIAALSINQVIYLYKVQHICEEKIKAGRNLNGYETFSAMQTHCAFWMFGWVIDPNTACLCFNKQFFVEWLTPVPDFDDDAIIKKAKQKLLRGEAKKVRLAWRDYSNRCSLLLNGVSLR